MLYRTRSNYSNIQIIIATNFINYFFPICRFICSIMLSEGAAHGCQNCKWHLCSLWDLQIQRVWVPHLGQGCFSAITWNAVYYLEWLTTLISRTIVSSNFTLFLITHEIITSINHEIITSVNHDNNYLHQS